MTVRTDIEQGGVLAIVDEQDIVYRAPGSALPGQPSALGGDEPLPETAASAVLTFDVDPVVLFRFSALTYNAHRIHYDRGYVAEEGYPDLLVHGPLQALLMGELIRRSGVPVIGRRFFLPAGGAHARSSAPDRDGDGGGSRYRRRGPGRQRRGHRDRHPTLRHDHQYR